MKDFNFLPKGYVEEFFIQQDECHEDHYGKDHNIWIQTYSTPRGREEEIVEAAAAAYDAGARTIIAWGYYGSESNNYAAKNPEKTWTATCAAFRRVREMERDRILGERRARVRK